MDKQRTMTADESMYFILEYRKSFDLPPGL